jgi:hypothetical protein
MFLNRFGIVLLGSFVVGTSACATAERDVEPASAHDDTVLAVAGASAASKTELGVVEWRIHSGAEPASFEVRGVDDHGALRVHVAIDTTASSDGVSRLVYDVRTPSASTLTYESSREGETSHGGDLDGNPIVRSVVSRIADDLDDLPIAQPVSLTTRSLTPRAGGPQYLIERDGPTCLVDEAGEDCRWEAGKAAKDLLVAAGCFLLTRGASQALCAGDAPEIGVQISELVDRSCKLRPCKDRNE